MATISGYSVARNTRITKYSCKTRLERTAGRDITLHGIQIPKGMQVGVPIIALHLDADIWPEPEKFDPDR